MPETIPTHARPQSPTTRGGAARGRPAAGAGRFPARRIAAITFTNKSAREMKERVAKRLKGDAGEGLTVCTFHALGLRILQVEHAKLGLRRGFSIFDAEDSATQFKDLCRLAASPTRSSLRSNWSRAPRTRGCRPTRRPPPR